jgi:catechol 2,3-dioxygenase-like lactoylglutathione lyase family enzyme
MSAYDPLPVSLPARISAVTFACRDIGRMAAFYRQFGWPEAPTSVPEHVVFQCMNGVVLGLFSETVFDREFGPVADGFRGFAVTVHCESVDAVHQVHERLRRFDDILDLDERPHQSGWGCGFSFKDPEGNVWDIAFKYGSDFDHRGGFIYP